MEEKYVIMSVLHPGSFWCDIRGEFKGWLFATKYSEYKRHELEGGKARYDIDKARLIEPCTLIKVYDK